MMSNIELCDSYGIMSIGKTKFLFDIEDLHIAENRDWYCDKDGYLVSCYYYNGARRFVRFHRIVVGAKPQEIVDHINGNRADNRKANLRCCSRAENSRNRKVSSTNKSGVTGVFYDSERGKWSANIIFNAKRIYLGRFESKEDAVRARLAKEQELYKEFTPVHYEEYYEENSNAI